MGVTWRGGWRHGTVSPREEERAARVSGGLCPVVVEFGLSLVFDSREATQRVFRSRPNPTGLLGRDDESDGTWGGCVAKCARTPVIHMKFALVYFLFFFRLLRHPNFEP